MGIIPIEKFVSPYKENDIESANSSPGYCTRFIVMVRVEHEHAFYIRQVLGPSTVITIVCCLPLAMPPGTGEDLGDRLSTYVGGLLTLVAFRYGISDHLPVVPYRTYIDSFLQWQILTVSACAF